MILAILGTFAFSISSLPYAKQQLQRVCSPSELAICEGISENCRRMCMDEACLLSSYVFILDDEKTKELELSDDVRTIVDELHSITSISDWNMRDIRVIFILVAKRLYTFQQSAHISTHICDETMNTYVPIVDALGFDEIRNELGDLSFLKSHPLEYAKIRTNLQKTSQDFYSKAMFLSSEIARFMKHTPYGYNMEMRRKAIFSLYHKMIKMNRQSCNDLADIVAIRVTLNTTEYAPCYQVMMFIQGTWPVVKHSTHDYILYPKSNGYMTLHTTVNVSGIPIEVQIRTAEMHENAELGSAAHALYKADHLRGIIRDLLDRRDLKSTQYSISHIDHVECLPTFGDEIVLDSRSYAFKLDKSLPELKKIDIYAIDERAYLCRLALLAKNTILKDVRMRCVNGHIFITLFALGNVDKLIVDIESMSATIKTRLQQIPSDILH